MNFDGVYFKGKFRDYQQRVLDNSEKFLNDHKINIVAAPGSGKTILGLELIRRLNNPCIILSPTTTIRQQWGKRFEESFEFNKNDGIEYVSYDLNNVSLINSITYQALYSAMNKISTSTDDETVDYSKIELLQLMNKNNIKTICLDEAHHLQNEWQKALEKFVKGLDKDIVVISLTATPPYDSNKTEWDRYVAVSGEIDDEIFVPELVMENTLCPHQDYIVFNYPVEKEIAKFKNYHTNSFLALNEICKLDYVRNLNSVIENIYKKDQSYIYQFFAEIVAIFILLDYEKIKINKRIFKKLTNSSVVPAVNRKFATRAVNFLIKENLLSDEQKEEIINILKKYNLLERNRAVFDLSERLKKEIVSSIGKLESIKQIVNKESCNLEERLRMLILTDYIKKETVSNIGKDVFFDCISVVSIFETIRREKPNAKIACVSGSLVILSDDVVHELGLKDNFSNKFKYTKINDTDFNIVTFKGDNREKVDIITKLFEKGSINILIGTQSLLGEGWDSPCINSIILASYVGSFVLSNQMRGRAIRIDKHDLNKVSNIWHLVTIEPSYMFQDNLIAKAICKYLDNPNEVNSFDFDTLKRRFDCFVGPNYDSNEIESGIDRITTIKPPFNKSKIEEMNEKTFEMASDRNHIREIWENATNNSAKSSTSSIVNVPQECRVPTFVFFNGFAFLTDAIILGISASSCAKFFATSNIFAAILCILVFGVCIYFFRKLVMVIIKNFSPRKSIESMSKAVLKTMKDLELVSKNSRLEINSDKNNAFIAVEIKNASVHEQNIFNEAIRQLLSPIENPKYLIIKKNIFGKYDYSQSFACPSIISNEDLGVECLKKNFNAIGDIDVVYAYHEYGKKLSLKCRNKSYITKNSKFINKKYKLTKFD